MKAFLSHSSKDKEIVAAVARELGRQFCFYAEQAFTTGDEFKASIERGFDDSSVLVLFASRSAMESIWVKFELEEAWFQRLHGTLVKSLVYIIDSSVKTDDLPDWLRRALIRKEISPKVIARDIRSHLDELLRQRQNPYFVGRREEIAELEEALMPFDGSSPPHAMFIGGLPGVGRRSLVRNSTTSILNFKKHIEILIGEGDSINDICISVADRVEPYATRDGFERIVHQIRDLSDDEATQRTMNNLRAMSKSGELPIFIDEGGILDSEGYVREPIQTILRALAPNDDAYIFLVSSRRPQNLLDIAIPSIHLSPLKEDENKRLISMLANKSGLQISSSEISALSEYVAGYPPAAYFAIQQAKYYGLNLVLSYKARLVQFRTSVFLKHLAKLNLAAEAQNLLRLLAAYSPLPLIVMSKVLNIEPEILQETIIQLVDLALVIVTDDGFYQLADPVSGAAEAAFGFPTEIQHKSLANVLNEFLFTELPSDLHRLALSRVLFRAALMARDEAIADSAFHFANDLIRLTEKLYHERRYSEAIKVGYMALEERPDSINARSYLIRALIQEEKWEEAGEMIRKLQSYAPNRDVYFLSGFLARKHGDISKALDAYKEAQRLGRRGVDLSRELAYCYFIEGDLEQASKYIEEALDRHSDNRFIVDLWAQIATSKGDETAARQALGRLELVDNPLYYHHRASRIALAFNKLQEARDQAKLAANSSEHPPFEVLAQLIYCEIELGDTDEAAELLTSLDQRFGNIRRDIRLGLRCRLEIARGRYSEALNLSERITDKNTFFYKKIRFDALEGEVLHSALRDDVRAAYEDELSRLEMEITDVKPDMFFPTEIDNFPH